jgi:hypothetical protein
MSLASQASILAWPALIGPPCSRVAAPTMFFRSLRLMVTVPRRTRRGWSFPALQGCVTEVQVTPQHLFEGLAAAGGGGSGVGGAIGRGVWGGEAVDGLGEEFHPEVVQLPFEGAEPGAGVACSDGQFDLVGGWVFVEGAVGVAGEGDHPGEGGERVRFGELPVFDEQVLDEFPGVWVDGGWQAFHGVHDGPGLLQTDQAGGECVGQSG